MRGRGTKLRHFLTGSLLCLGLSVGLFLGVASAPMAQQAQGAISGPISTPILTLDSERLIAESAAGQAIEAELAEKSVELAAENRRIETELTEEEKDLTERRANLTPEEFRAEAASFDDKVQTIREEQDAQLRVLQEQANLARRDILGAADPVLVSIMQEAGAVIIMEKSNVLASLQAIDVTNLAIDRLDRAMSGNFGTIGGFDTGTFDTAPPQNAPAPLTEGELPVGRETTPGTTDEPNVAAPNSQTIAPGTPLSPGVEGTDK